MTHPLKQQIDDMVSGKFKTEHLPWNVMSHVSRALIPGAITMLCGTPGASKTFMLLQSMLYWIDNGLACVLYALEDYKEYHLLRMLAQHTETAGLVDDEWVRENPDTARKLSENNAALLTKLRDAIECTPDKMPTLTELADWVENRAKGGARIICIDPITIASKGQGYRFEDEDLFIKQASRICGIYKCTLVLVTHPTKGSKPRPDIAFMAGSAAFSRFTSTVLWLEFHDEKINDIITPVGNDTQEHNRTVHILKSRNGKGQGKRFAFSFCPKSLTLIEHGIIVKKKKG